jgi:hypothetical protein
MKEFIFMFIALQNILMWKYAQNVDGIMISMRILSPERQMPDLLYFLVVVSQRAFICE